MDSTRACASLLGLASTSTAGVHLAFGLCVGTDVLEGCSVAVVAVDTSKLTTVNSSNTLFSSVFNRDAYSGTPYLNIDIALALLGALNMMISTFLCSVKLRTYVSA